MKIALFGKEYKDEHHQYLQLLIDELVKRQATLTIYRPYLEKIIGKVKLPEKYQLFDVHYNLIDQAEMLFSIGGDGTLLDTIPFIRGSGIPILGINTRVYNQRFLK